MFVAIYFPLFYFLVLWIFGISQTFSSYSHTQLFCTWKSFSFLGRLPNGPITSAFTFLSSWNWFWELSIWLVLVILFADSGPALLTSYFLNLHLSWVLQLQYLCFFHHPGPSIELFAASLCTEGFLPTSLLAS